MKKQNSYEYRYKPAFGCSDNLRVSDNQGSTIYYMYFVKLVDDSILNAYRIILLRGYGLKSIKGLTTLSKEFLLKWYRMETFSWKTLFNSIAAHGYRYMWPMLEPHSSWHHGMLTLYRVSRSIMILASMCVS